MPLDSIKAYKVDKIKKDLVLQYGDLHDGVIEFIGIVDKGYIEVGYFYGDDKPKNIIAVSQQVGCPGKCKFCELGSMPFIRSLSSTEIYEQVVLMLQQAEEYGFDIQKIKHKVNFSKSGEPLLNPNFVEGLEKVGEFDFSYKVSTIFPYGTGENFNRITDFASTYSNNVQIQISLISTNEKYREQTAGIKLTNFKDIRKSAEYWKHKNPKGRKINLSLILTDSNPIDVNDVYNDFPPELFRFRFRNYVPNNNGSDNRLETIRNDNFNNLIEEFREKGYETGTWATPTNIEKRFGLAANVNLARYLKIVNRK